MIWKSIFIGYLLIGIAALTVGYFRRGPDSIDEICGEPQFGQVPLAVILTIIFWPLGFVIKILEKR